MESKEGRAAPEYKTLWLMMAIMFMGKLLGVVRDRMQGVYFGTDTSEGIAFMQASVLPRIFLDMLFASAFSASFIPVFNMYLQNKDKKAAFDLAALFISVMLALTAAVTLVCAAGAPVLYTLLLDGEAITPQTRLLGISLLRCMLPLLILSGLAFSFTGILQSLGEFKLPAAMSVVSNGVILIYYIFFIDRFGVYGLCAAFLLGWAAQSLIQLPFLIKARFRFRFRFNLRDPGLKQIAALALPVTVASWVGPVNLAVNGKAAAGLPSGSFNGLHFAYNLFTVISGVYVLSVANIIFPKLSRQAAGGDDTAFANTLREALRGLFFLLLPMTFGLIAVGEPVVRLVYEGGLFRENAVDATTRALVFFAPGILGYGLQIILSRACFAKQDGRTPLYAAAAAIIINAALSFTLAGIMGIAGPALASSISITVTSVWMLYAVNRRCGYTLWPRGMTKDVLKMAVMAVFMYVLVLYCQNFMDTSADSRFLSRLAALAIPVGAGAASYMAGCFIIGVEETRRAAGYIKRKVTKK
jgi:putative peptidoglycan lipid II flippase